MSPSPRSVRPSSPRLLSSPTAPTCGARPTSRSLPTSPRTPTTSSTGSGTGPSSRTTPAPRTASSSTSPSARPPAGGEHLESAAVFEDQLYTSCLQVKVEGEPLVKSEASADGSLGATTSKFAMNRFINNPEDWNEAAVRGQLENQFQVNVADMPKPENGAAPGAPGAGAPSAPAPAPAPTPTTPPANGAPDGIRTVTVTAAPTTVYATATVTAGAPGLPVRSVEPFMKARRSNWAFGRD